MTEQEARAILRAVEPEHAHRERSSSVAAAEDGDVILVNPTWPHFAQDVACDVWRVWWRVQPVPPLPRRTDRCEATGARPISCRAPMHSTVKSRYGERRPLVGPVWLFTLDDLLFVRPTARRRVTVDVVDPEPPKQHGGPFNEPRGWCPVLAPRRVVSRWPAGWDAGWRKP